MCLLLGILVLVAMIDYSPDQKRYWNPDTTSPSGTNLVGFIGADTAHVLFIAFGAAAWLVSFFLFWLFYINMKGNRLRPHLAHLL